MRTTKALAAASLAITALLAVSACGSSSTGGTTSPSTSGSTGGQAATEAAASTEPADNGIADKSADEILAAAKAAAKAESSVHIEGTVSIDGEKTTMDVLIDEDGQAQTTMSMGGATVEVISTGKTAYVRGNKQFWVTQTEAGADGYKLFKDKWLLAASAEEVRQLGAMADFDTLIDEVLKASGSITKGSTSDIDGTPAIGLLDGTTGTLWVATIGDPLPLQIENTDGSTLSFSRWSEPITITEPDPDDVIDPSKIGQ